MTTDLCTLLETSLRLIALACAMNAIGLAIGQFRQRNATSAR